MTVITHPLVQHNLTRLRDERTGSQEFRRVLSEVAALMIYEATRSLEVKSISVSTPLSRARGFTLRHARIPAELAQEFTERVLALANEFTRMPRGGTREYAFLAGVFPTIRPVAPEDPA